MEEGAGEGEDWAVGLSSFVEAELQSAGLPLVERRDIRMVLAERRLNESGVVRQQDLFRQRLPSVRYLVKGTIRPRDGDRFLVTVSAVDIGSGSEVARLEGEGAYPEDLVATVRRLTADLPRELAVAVTPPSPREKLPGFTETPEIAFLFYRGTEHLMAGRPGHAILSFEQATDADPQFWVARLWTGRAYQQAGLPGVAAVAFRELHETTAGRRFLDTRG